MKHIWVIAQKEFLSYFRNLHGYVIIACVLSIIGLLFNAWAIGTGMKYSTQVLESFFYLLSGVVLTSSVLISMRLIAEEKQRETFVVLATSPLENYEIILGKYLSSLLFLLILCLSTLYMPLLIMIHGKISLGHIFVGYLGVFLMGASGCAIGILCSALSSHAFVAAFLSAVSICFFMLCWLLSRIAEPPLDFIIGYLSMHDKHFLSFMRGILSIKDIVFYISLIYVSLTLSTRILEARQWK